MYIGYSFYSRISPEEIFLDDERVSKNRRVVKRVFLLGGLIIMFSSVVPNPTHADLLPGANGFSPPMSRAYPKK